MCVELLSGSASELRPLVVGVRARLTHNLSLLNHHISFHEQLNTQMN